MKWSIWEVMRKWCFHGHELDSTTFFLDNVKAARYWHFPALVLATSWRALSCVRPPRFNRRSIGAMSVFTLLVSSFPRLYLLSSKHLLLPFDVRQSPILWRSPPKLWVLPYHRQWYHSPHNIKELLIKPTEAEGRWLIDSCWLKMMRIKKLSPAIWHFVLRTYLIACFSLILALCLLRVIGLKSPLPNWQIFPWDFAVDHAPLLVEGA